MAAVKPLNSETLSLISGVGAHKLGRYGPQFLQVIREYAGN